MAAADLWERDVMELYQLEHFIAVVEEHSFTKGADRVFRTEGAVSVTIRKLEEEVGVPLVVRNPHECTLTEAGHALLEHAQRIVRLSHELQSRMADIRNLVSGRVTIAAHESAAQYLLSAPLTAFHLQHPNIIIKTSRCDGDQIAHLVAERDADLGFGIRQTNLRGLHAQMLLNDPLVLVAAPGHDLARKRGVTMADMRHQRFFIHSRRTPMLALVERLFADHRIPFAVAAELADFETIKQLVAAGRGVAIIPWSAVRTDLEAGRLVAVPMAHLRIDRPIEVVYSKTARLLPAPARFLELLSNWTWDRPSGPAPPRRRIRTARSDSRADSRSA
jgi:DNA-binding transcriptional LysR family regulator